MAGSLVDSIVLRDSPNVAASLLCFQLVCEQGKRSLGEGDNLIGESLPRLFLRAGLKGVVIRQNDRGWSLVPPYSSPFERAEVEEILDAVDREIWIWDQATTRRYFLAGGGSELDFPQRWSMSTHGSTSCRSTRSNWRYKTRNSAGHRRNSTPRGHGTPTATILAGGLFHP